ncbi:MAG TPA: hypothetical protein VGQ09_08500 [Chitinophagaceae bacterium]|nr:hypothetical protein [Chitinophagaceae bacterium]
MIGGGGQWLIEAIYKNYSDFWYADWKVGNQDDPERKIWSVLYETVAKKEQIRNLQFLLNASKEALEKKLTEIEAFARENDLEFWADVFKNALKALHSEKPNADSFYFDLIMLKNYSLLAQQLIFGAAAAWIFGAMGSWNDMSFQEKDKNEKYEKLTEELYDAVIIALIAGINTY